MYFHLYVIIRFFFIFVTTKCSLRLFLFPLRYAISISETASMQDIKGFFLILKIPKTIHVVVKKSHLWSLVVDRKLMKLNLYIFML